VETSLKLKGMEHVFNCIVEKIIHKENFKALKGPQVLHPYGAIREEIVTKKIFSLTCQCATIDATSDWRFFQYFFNNIFLKFLLYLHCKGPKIYSLAALCKVQIFPNDSQTRKSLNFGGTGSRCWGA